jgi:Rieske Fe-S protein
LGAVAYERDGRLGAKQDYDARMRLPRVVLGSVVALGALSAAALGVASVLTSDDALHPPWTRVTTVDELQARRVVYSATTDAYVLDTGAGIRAVVARSTQKGEPVRYCSTSGWFEDLRHGSMFDSVGQYVLGPAPRGLDQLEVAVVSGEVWVDPTQLTTGPPRGARDLRPAGPFCWRGD